MKKIVTLLLICLLAFPTMALAEEEIGSAAALRLERAEGSVALRNHAGRNMTVIDGMLLSSGNALTTELASYAYISLDDAKAIKMDASTEVEIRESGDHMQVILLSGNVFFDVSEPLAESASLTVSSGVMITGIRGTTGALLAGGGGEYGAFLLSGRIEITGMDENGNIARYEIGAGEYAVITTGDDGAPVIETRPLTLEDIRGFIAVAVLRDPALQELVAANTDIDLETLLQTALEILARDELIAQQLLEEYLNLYDTEISIPWFNDGAGPGETTPEREDDRSSSPPSPSPNATTRPPSSLTPPTGSPDDGENPGSTNNPEESEKPEETEEPEATEAPEETEEPEETDKPENTGEPGSSNEPEDSAEPTLPVGMPPSEGIPKR